MYFLHLANQVIGEFNKENMYNACNGELVTDEFRQVQGRSKWK